MTKMNKQPDGKVAAENISGRPVPRRKGLKNETAGKRVGTRNIRNLSGRRVIDHTRKGR